MSKLPCCMNINALNEDNLCFIRKVLEQVPSLKSHSVDFLLYESQHNAIFPLKSTFPTWSRIFFPSLQIGGKKGGKIPLLWNQTFKGFIQHINQRWERGEEEEEEQGEEEKEGGGGGNLPYLYRSCTLFHRSQPCPCRGLPRGAARHVLSRKAPWAHAGIPSWYPSLENGWGCHPAWDTSLCHKPSGTHTPGT